MLLSSGACNGRVSWLCQSSLVLSKILVTIQEISEYAGAGANIYVNVSRTEKKDCIDGDCFLCNIGGLG